MKITPFIELTAAGFILTGCLGSEIIGRSPKNQAPFPSLQSVPERPPKEDLTAVQQTLDQQTRDQSDVMAFNRDLRRQLGLSTPQRQEK